jgi:predicted  nucleic acid-binding Zn-ribbon protein
MQHQIEAAGVEIGQQEERTLVNMMEADEVNAAIKKAEAGLKAAQAKMNAEKSIIEKDVETSKTIVADCAARRAKLVATMDNKGVVETFERIAKVRGTAIARAEGERCTVCQVRLRPVVYQSVIRNEAIVQCDSCQRILYFVAPKAPQAPEAR